jgi:hypothetical protein
MSEGPARLQFTLKSLIFATALIAAGAALVGHLLTPAHVSFREAKVVLAYALIGAGLLLPFHRARLGAYIGFFGILTYALAVEAYRGGWGYILQSLGLLPISLACAFVTMLGAFSIGRVIWRRWLFPKI